MNAMTSNLNPPPISPGGVLAFVGPASSVNPAEIKGGAAYFERRGFVLKSGDSLFERNRFLAGADVGRAADIMSCFRDPDVCGIICARGGYGSMRILDQLDYGLIAANPKFLLGFSDLTALQLALLRRSGLVTFTGATAATDFPASGPGPLLERSLDIAFRGKPLAVDGLEPLRPGTAEGPLVGGCLSLITRLLGTPYMPDLRGAILFLEDVHEEPYRIDRMLTHLRLAGVFERVAGVVFGGFCDCLAKDPDDGTVADVLAELPRHVTGPVVTGLAYGHGQDRYVLPLGRRARLHGTMLQIDGCGGPG